MAHDVNQCEMDVAAQVRSALVDRISSERYDLWIPAETVWQWNDGKLNICFPSDFAHQLAKKMFASDISACCRNVCGDDATVEYAVDENLSKQVATRGATNSCSNATPNPMDADETSAAVRLNQTSAPANASALAVRERLTQRSQASQRSHRHATAGGDGDAFTCQNNANQNNAKPEAVLQDNSAPRPASPRFTFSNSSANPAQPKNLWNAFIPGECNKLAWTAASMAVNDPGRITPMFIHGPSGCGKSMLIAAVVQQLRFVQRLRRVVHMTSEQFTNDFTESLKGGGLPLFRRKYRDVEALVIEDIHFFVGKKSTLAEAKHTIDNLIRLGKQVVLTADRSVNELQHLGDELIGRLRGGLTSPMFPLDAITRRELLTRHLASAQLALDEDTITALSERLSGDSRVVSGVVNRLMAVASLNPGQLDWNKCWDAVFDLVQATQPVVRLRDIEQAVCTMFGLQSDSLQSSSKMRSVSQPRMLAMFLARKYTPAAYKEIGQYFGKRRHSTVISAEKTVEGWLKGNERVQLGRGLDVRDAIRHVESQLQVG